ncbi:EGF domain-specific O-linked N-acetylglucosamine transferase [Chlorella sorokiniana]|uniref:EGF domain-specific O-linked N-acetylglucosamine transferase n=1 Tax=Chlorella sorokiniana TaxID=3076 RepID=A0A2P6TLJ6_CHLSO|nr:EGF domain-specific O-linked N-acetylglucosamine transferase [Chlorella sorokiniana]|eukprot:PRW45163.1 EGF domain-specific O-linked N-acetylglucosamine transferase [Chlorella sorokiniana]
MRPPQRRRHGNSSRRGEELATLLVVFGGLLLLFLGYRAFHRSAAERSDALQQLRAAKAGLAGGVGVTVGSGSVLGIGRRGGLVEIGALEQPGGSGGAHLDTLQQEAAAGDDDAGGSSGGAAADGRPTPGLLRFCEEHFGMEWVRRWGAAARQVCVATHQLAAEAGAAVGSSGSASTVTCRRISDTHLPPKSAPHVLCDATNLRLDPSKLRRARCPAHRPGYLCLSPTYHHYQRGAWAVNCSWPGFRVEDLSRDHQQDIFGSMLFAGDSPEGLESGTAAGGAAGAGGGAGLEAAGGRVQVEELPTLVVTRETKEHANVFHTFTDLLNTYITLKVMGWEDKPRQVVILDAHPPGPLDLFWPVAAAGGGPTAFAAVQQAQAAGSQQRQQQQLGSHSRDGEQVHPWDVPLPASSGGTWGGSNGDRLLVRRVEDFKGPVLFRHAAFVPPGYASLLFAHLYEPASCPLPTSLFAGFRRFLLGSFGLLGASSKAAAAAGADAAAAGTLDAAAGSSGQPLVVRIISRRPGPGKARMARQIGNELELLSALRALSSDDSSGGDGSSSGSQDGSGVGPLAVSLLDFAGMPLDQQLAAVAGTDILIGMHGAALTYAFLLSPHAALVELWPQAEGIWRCYENAAQWAGALYRRVANSDPARLRQTASGDVTDVDAAELAAAPTASSTAKLSISDNLVGVLDAKLEDGTLSIFHVKEAAIDTPLQVTLELPKSTQEFGVELFGVGGAILGPGFSFSKLSAGLSGATRLSAGSKRDFSAKQVALQLSGSSVAVVEGELGSVDLSASGSTKAWLLGVTGGVTLDMSGTSQSYFDAASDAVQISGQVSGVVTNSYTKGQCSVTAGNPITNKPCNQVARLPTAPAPPRWTCGLILTTPADPGCPWTPNGSRRRSLSKTVIISGPGASSITTSNSRSTIVSTSGTTTAVAYERVACSVGADQLVVTLK